MIDFKNINENTIKNLEKRGIHIHWIEATLPIKVKVEKILELI